MSETPDFLDLDDGHRLAYHKSPGRSPGVMFLPGYMSDMEGSKAVELEAYCRLRGQAFLRFDYTGHGFSSGKFEDGTIGRWAADAVAALDRLTEGPQVLVGSSMGGWLMLLTALARPDRVAGLVGLAAAPDFTADLLPTQLPAEYWQAIREKGVAYVPSPYGPDLTPFTKNLVEEAENQLILRAEIPLDCPVRLLHGMEDPDVPWQTSLAIQEKLRSPDVVVTLIKDGDHRLSREEDLAKLALTVGTLLEDLEAEG
ncbi:MAG: alpha/beta fold hydrolase [Magnetospiraceae bacterium]